MSSQERASQAEIEAKASARAGFFFAFFAYTLWGFLPLYLKFLDHISAVEVVAHRAFWSLPIAAILLFFLGRMNEALNILKNPRNLGILFFTAFLISLNWGVYVWAISVERTIEAALGYYINPLMSVALGALLLGERFTRAQIAALLLATLAVMLLAVKTGVFPWMGLFLAASFAGYGFLRKTISVGPTQGFLIEVILLSCLALPFIIWLQLNGEGNFFESTSNTLLLIGCGPITAIPLILYAFGAKRLRLSSLGLMQYIAPTLIFIMGVFVFDEPFDLWQLAAFILIWIALAIFSTSAMKQQKAN